MENPIVLAPQTLMMPTVKKIFADAMSGNIWTSRNMQTVGRMGVGGNNPRNIGKDYGITSPYLILRIVTTDPPYGLNVILKVG